MVEFDVYILLHILTTCDDHGVSVNKDQSEVIEIGWIMMDAKSHEPLSEVLTLIKPTNTPITPLCTSLTSLSWDSVRDAGTFKETISKLENQISEKLVTKGKSFVFVTFNSWDIKVHIPRESRDKNVVLSKYLQYPKVFDLKLEFQKWQAHMGETTAGYNATNILNMCSTLDIDILAVREKVRALSAALDIVDLNTISNGYYLPRRSIEHIYIIREVFYRLVAISKNRCELFNTPFDLNHDIREFLTEKSKVLYMSNLPYDTTQSELEAWFSRFGGRPIAFRTLQTPDPHKLLGSGFAIFATHESASESLAMNGRSLNDRSIEIQPSSFKLLDFAQEILVPFPLSKNRSRPGDWTCPSCGFSNFQRRTACFRCSFPAASAAAIQESIFDLKKQPMLGGSYNGGYGSQNRSTVNGSIKGYLQPTSNTTGNNNNNNINNGNNNSIPFRAGDWNCDNCTYHNFAKNVFCLRCGLTRVTQFGSLNKDTSHMPLNGYGGFSRQPYANGYPSYSSLSYSPASQSLAGSTVGTPVSVQFQTPTNHAQLLNGNNTGSSTHSSGGALVQGGYPTDGLSQTLSGNTIKSSVLHQPQPLAMCSNEAQNKSDYLSNLGKSMGNLTISSGSGNNTHRNASGNDISLQFARNTTTL